MNLIRSLYSDNLPLTASFASGAAAMILVVALATVYPVQAQIFDNLSDESDGALNFAWAVGQPQPIVLDPTDDATFDPGSGRVLDPDRDHIFHFTTVSIPVGVTVRLSGEHFDGPVYWLASGGVQVTGTIDLNGERGQDQGEILNSGSRISAMAGAGGFSGGVGAIGSSPARNGAGPGKGMTGPLGGAGAGHAAAGENSAEYKCTSSSPGQGGVVYGNSLLVPLLGGSGGAGGTTAAVGGAGGAGGGALLIASADSISIAGGIRANGGRGGNSTNHAGGGGSGGSIRLVAPAIFGTGSLTAAGGARGSGVFVSCSCFCCGGCPPRDGRGGAGSPGRIRLEATDHQFTGSSSPASTLGTPLALFLPDTPPPTLRVTSVAGTPLINPMASFTPADVQIDTSGSVVVQIEARNLPTLSGNPSEPTIVQLHIISENAPDQVVDSTPLAGTTELSTTTINVTFPFGFSRAYVRATWNRLVQ